MTTFAPPAAPGKFDAVVYAVRRSRSMASMLPSLLLSGVITLAVSAVLHLTWSGAHRGFAGAWMESWLVTWPIAFPLIYLLGSVLPKLATVISAPARREETGTGGLALCDITQASAGVTAKNGFTVLRKLKPAHDYRAP